LQWEHSQNIIGNKVKSLWEQGNEGKLFKWTHTLLEYLGYKAFACDVTAAMLAFQFKIILIRPQAELLGGRLGLVKAPLESL
jgi:hypothetical protein